MEIAAGRKEQEAFITYREPFIGKWNIPVQLQIFQSDDNTRAETQILQRGLPIVKRRKWRCRRRVGLFAMSTRSQNAK